MRLFHLITIFLLLNTVYYTVADVIKARYDSSCGYLNNKIYCFGGAIGEVPKVSEQILNTLDLIPLNGSTSAELDLRWSTITVNSESIIIQPRDSPQTIQIPGSDYLVISGGFYNFNSNLISQTLLFNGKNQTWREYSNYTVSPYGNRQIFEASSVYVPGYGIGYYGGQESNFNKNYTNTDLNLTAYEFKAENSRYIGYTSLTFLNIDLPPAEQWYTFPQTNKPIRMPFYHKSVYDYVNKRILFVGGVSYDTVNDSFLPYSLDSAITFNLESSEWSTQVLSGTTPGQRSGHSLTIIGSDQRHALLYGGYNETAEVITAVSDYCYTLDLDANQWTLQSTLTSNNTAMRRFQHSMIPVSNDTLLIVLGKDSTTEPSLATLMLNVTNPSSINLLERFIAPAPATTIVTVQGPETTETTELSGLSSGAIAGIAVGATAAGLIVITFIIFCIFKKRKEEKRRIREIEEMQRNQQMEEPVMEVNWDELEKYTELPINPSGHFSYSPQLSNENNTVVENNMSVISHSPMLIQEGIKTQSPNVVEEVAQVHHSNVIEEYSQLQRPDVAENDFIHDSNRTNLLQKPDGA